MFMLHGRLAAKPGKRVELLAVLAEGEHAEPLPGFRRQQLDARAGFPR